MEGQALRKPTTVQEAWNVKNPNSTWQISFLKTEFYNHQ